MGARQRRHPGAETKSEQNPGRQPHPGPISAWAGCPPPPGGTSGAKGTLPGRLQPLSSNCWDDSVIKIQTLRLTEITGLLSRNWQH